MALTEEVWLEGDGAQGGGRCQRSGRGCLHPSLRRLTQHRELGPVTTLLPRTGAPPRGLWSSFPLSVLQTLHLRAQHFRNLPRALPPAGSGLLEPQPPCEAWGPSHHPRGWMPAVSHVLLTQEPTPKSPLLSAVPAGCEGVGGAARAQGTRWAPGGGAGMKLPRPPLPVPAEQGAEREGCRTGQTHRRGSLSRSK